MAKFSSSPREKISGMRKLNAVVKKLQKSLRLGKRSNSCNNEYVPEDVEEGHFAVIAMGNEESRRFVVPLRFLTHPAFVILLEQAAEEFGFNPEGVLAILCRPCELERILAEECRYSRGWAI
ncbi:hypothetical protein P3X46_009981 [Hevea brasiliensis]|uniref:SAUR family protein n=1 Tax=Hevea brasiliensis TaxID=3981 RepID=A0ABQ9MEP5_HEVBR|nr:protein SMALL AUXIN UP-REGULATED RNA 12-like [Hevea brasiliensis]KAJ9178065.1 hypothetical protein P3X46_009981 [Hevea brasiliensis]